MLIFETGSIVRPVLMKIAFSSLRQEEMFESLLQDLKAAFVFYIVERGFGVASCY